MTMKQILAGAAWLVVLIAFVAWAVYAVKMGAMR
jgi:hypothetical protein